MAYIRISFNILQKWDYSSTLKHTIFPLAISQRPLSMPVCKKWSFWSSFQWLHGIVTYGPTLLSLTRGLLMCFWILSSFPNNRYSSKHPFTLTFLSSCRSISLWWIPRRWIIIGSKDMSISFLIVLPNCPPIILYWFTPPTTLEEGDCFPTPFSNIKIMQFKDVWCGLGVKSFSLWNFLPLKANKDIESLPLFQWTPCSEWADTQTDI